jgi:DNA-binding protein H-NS
MSNYHDYLKQIEELTKKAETARREETTAVIADIKQKIKQFNLTAADIGLAAREPRANAKGTATKTAAAKSGAPAKAAGRKRAGPGRPAGTPSAQKGVKRRIKYRGPDGQAWSGVGRKPIWVTEALAAGRTLEDFAVQ